MVDINPVATPGIASSGLSEAKPVISVVRDAKAEAAKYVGNMQREQRAEAGREALESSAKDVEAVVNAVAQDTSLSFRVEEDLSRMVVAVRAVGSDEIIRQFPPEEFITVAKHIAAQNPDMIDEDYLKGVLFDQYS
jgi:uncharacterized FlaG/YvyC family protein